MTTVSTKHVQRHIGDPSMSIHKGTSILDDMEIIRKLCLPEKTDPSLRNASHLFMGSDAVPMKSVHQRDFGRPDMAQIEPKATRDARSLYMNGKHFELGYDPVPIITESRAAYQAPPRERLLEKKIWNIGAPNNKNDSSLFSSPADRAAWADDIETTNRVDFIPPGGNLRDVNLKKLKEDHRSNHFDFGSDPPMYESLAAASYPERPVIPRPVPVKLGKSAVQFGTNDYPWHMDLKSTNQADFGPPGVLEQDALTDFVKKGPPLRFGDDVRELMTEHRGAYKKNEFLDCSRLTNEQLAMLGVTREQIIPRKIPLPFLQSGMLRNSLGQRFGDQA